MRMIVDHIPRDASLAAVALSLLIALVTASASAQQPPPKPPAGLDPQSLSQALGQMSPLYEAMSQASLEGSLKVMERPENVTRMAVFARRYYEALIKQGFSREEAIQIAAGAGSPAVRLGR
jgi:hypothetical protein